MLRLETPSRQTGPGRARRRLCRRWSVWLLALTPLAGEANGLPLIVEAPQLPGDGIAVLVSGDGGWAALDAGVADELLAAGYGVVGLNAPRYFKSTKTPAQFAADLGTIATEYLATWHRTKLLLIGYSRGADLLPFGVGGLDPELRKRIEAVVLLAPASYANFTFHLADVWSSRRRSDDLANLPEARKLGERLICIFGTEEKDSLCPLLGGTDPRRVVVALEGGHHFDGDYQALGRRVLELVSTPSSPHKSGSE